MIQYDRPVRLTKRTVLFDSENVEEAIAELLLALPTDRSGELHYQLSVVYRRQGQMELAKQALAKSEELRTLDRKAQRERLERAVNAAEGSDPDHP